MMHAELIQQVLELPCFSALDCSAFPVTANDGTDNNPCFQVVDNDSQRIFFVKQHNASDLFKAKQYAEINQVLRKLSPEIVFQNDNWQVQTFIEGVTLFNSTLDIAGKLDISAKLMADLHRASIVDLLEPLQLKTQFERLIAELAIVAEPLSELVSRVATDFDIELGFTDLVPIHGDVNFANILIDTEDKAWLLDLEFLSLAPREYDLAMCFAINQLGDSEQGRLIASYQAANNIELNQQRLKAYLPVCLLLNGLWFYQRSAKTPVFLQKARWQLSQFEALTGHPVLSSLDNC